MSTELIDLRNRFLAQLTEEQDKRGQDLSWIEREEQFMFDLVNDERTRRGLSPIALEHVLMRARWATGHVDYSSKFALYCAELALGLTDRGP